MTSAPKPSALLTALSQLSPRNRTRLRKELARLLARQKLADYRPYIRQAEFHDAGATHRERLLRAGNQNGKTWAGGCEGAYHLTGQYPAWWQGRRFDRPITMWASGLTAETTRDNPQRILLGPIGEWGTGTIPGDRIIQTKPARGVADLLDFVKLRHRSGGLSTLRFKHYEQGRRSWQGPSVDVVWFDEEPPEEIYDEGLARTIATGGMAYLTFTPLLGMSAIVRRFLMAGSSDRHDTNMTIEDALHIPEAERRRIIASFPEHEREARAKGIPILGSGRIFALADSEVACEPFAVPDHFPRLGAMDFGWDHPFAAVELAHDTDSDIIYVTKAYRAREKTPAQHAIALKPWGGFLPWAWPRDGHRETLEGAGSALATQFREQGLKMMATHAQFADGSVSVEAGIMAILERMQSGRFKVFRHLNDWFEEFHLYHRKDGLVVKEMDDLMAATRYGLMMLRKAECPPRLFRRAAAGKPSDPLAGYR